MLKTNQAYRDENAVNLHENYKLLSGSVQISLFISTCLAVIMTVILHDQINTRILLLWLTVLCSVNVIRLIVHHWFKRHPSFNPEVILIHLRFFRFGAVMSGLAWGWAGFYFAQQVDLVYQLFITFTLGGLATGATSSLAVDKFAVVAFIFATILPNALHYFLSSGDIPIAMAIMLLIFTAFMLNSAKDQGKNLHENLKLRIQAKRDEAQFKEILNFSPSAASITNLSTLDTLFTNKRHLELFGTDATPFSENNNAIFLVDKSELDGIRQNLETQHSISNKLLKFHSQESAKNLWCIGSFVRVNYLDSPAVLSWFFDITDRIRMEEQIKLLAYHDSLTNLPNRHLFEDRLKLALKHAEREKQLLGVMFIDLDGFKSINDSHGHGVGDQLLKAVADRVSAILRQSDTLSRIGGDEFIVLLPKINEVDDAMNVAKKLLLALSKPFDINSHQLQMSASIGLAVYPQHGDSAQTLLKNADIAMYQVKDSGKNNVRLYKR